ncbi:MAG: hypothetical protein ACI4NG_05165 [Candidatus Gallimonas sp.]
MPNQMMLNAYKKLFGATDDAQARIGIEEHLHAISEMWRKEFGRNPDEAQARFEGRYYNFCEKQVKTAWTKNLVQGLAGEEHDRNTAQVTDEFCEYMRGINALLRERGVETAPNVDEIFEEGMDEEPDDGEELEEGEYRGWLNQWKRETLGKVPAGRKDAARFYLYGRDLETDREPSVKTSVTRAGDEVVSLCRAVNEENAAQKCVRAVATLRVVEEKHASRWLIWKIFHPIDNYRENRAIELMRGQISRTFSAEQIEAAEAQANADVGWIVAEKSDAILPSKSNELKVDPLESEARTYLRAAAETARTEQEKEELSRIAEELEPVAEEELFLHGAAESDKREESNAKCEENYRNRMGDTFEEALAEETEAYGKNAKESDFLEEFDGEKENLFVSEAEEPAQDEKSESSEEKDAPETMKNLK